MHDMECQLSRACNNYKAADWDLMHAHLATIDWSSVFIGVDDCENAWGRFKEVINNLVYLYVPVKMSWNRINAPWFNDSLKRMIRTKKRKWNKYKRSRQTSHLREYRQHCRSVKAAVNFERAKYEKNRFQNKQDKPKELFSYHDKLTKSSNRILSLKLDNKEITNDEDKCEALSQYYTEIFTADNDILPNCLPKLPPNIFTHVEIND